MTAKPQADTAPVVIKKYANRRLYNTGTSSYVTLDNLSQMVREGRDFVVFDAKSGDDITRSVLTQIIVEEEGKGQNLLPIGFLRQLIGFYGNNMQWLVPRYLDYAMKSFAHNQEQLSKTISPSLGGLFPFGQFEEMSKQNLALFEKAMKMFTSFGGEAGPAGVQPGMDWTPPAVPVPVAPATPEPADAIRELMTRVNQLQSQLDGLSAKEK